MKKGLELLNILPAIAVLPLLWLGFLVTGQDPTLIEVVGVGGNYVPMTTDGEWWRLLISLFLNDDIVVITGASFVVLLSLPLLASHLSPVAFTASFLVAGFLSSTLLMLHNPQGVFIGSLGAIMGVSGLILSGILRRTFTSKLLPFAFAAVALSGLLVFLNLPQLEAATTGAVFGFVLGMLTLDRELKDQLVWSAASFLVPIIGFNMVVKKFNYIPIYQQYVQEKSECLNKAEGFLNASTGNQESKIIRKKEAMLSAILSTSCSSAVRKSEQVTPLALQVYGELQWQQINATLKATNLLLQAELETMRVQVLKHRLAQLRRDQQWVEMAETLEQITSPENIDKLMDELKLIPKNPFGRIRNIKLRSLVHTKQLYEKMGKAHDRLKNLMPKAVGPNQGNEKLTLLTARFEDKKEKCFEYVDKIELTKEYYFVDFEAQLEATLRELCRPALFLSERLIEKSVSEPNKRYWETLNDTVRKNIWKIHATLEVIRLKEFKHELSKLEYEKDYQQVHKLRKTVVVNRINNIQMLMGEYRDKFTERASTRDEFIANKLSAALLGYQKIQSRASRLPASN